jgi:phospholipid/cholesterol/gamma-HCH transport system permease protein
MQRGFSRTFSVVLFGGQVFWHLGRHGLQYPRPYQAQLFRVGPGAIAPVLIVTLCASVIFTVQTARELAKFGAVQLVGGAFALAFCRELAPIVTACVLAGQVGAAIASELGTMRITEQIDALLMMQTHPIDFLVIPRILACGIMMPVLTAWSISLGLLGGMLSAAQLYQVPAAIFWQTVRSALSAGDLGWVAIKSVVFGLMVGLIGCHWGLTTEGSAKAVGESATHAVVVTWITIFVIDMIFALLTAQLPWTV